jgi:WD40 repeat protein
MKTRSVLAKGARGIQCVAVSNCGTMFAAVDHSEDHNVYVFDAATGQQKHKMKGDTNRIYDVCFSGAPGS